jgi:ABC-type branched-subunit amino acid transport system ATPase component
MLVAEGLRKRYRSREVVHDFGLTLDAGEVVGLLGPNGAGKTTCFYMIVGLVPADAGRILLDGRDISAEPMYTRAKLGVGYLPQEPSVFRKLSVADNLRLVLELRPDLDRAGRQPVRRRTSTGRNRPRAGRQTAPHAARRAFCRRRSDLGRGNPAHRPSPQESRHWCIDHRP